MSTRLPDKHGEPELRFLDRLASTAGRRTFLQWSGLTMAVVALACSDDDNSNVGPGTGTSVDLGSGDTGVLNYAYALEQLEAAFYTQVLAGAYFGSATSEEQSLLTDIRNQVDFTSVNFGDRTSVLGAARTFEDLGVAAYNGAGRLLTNPEYLLVAGKIVSVEARHAAAIRDLLAANSFASSDVVDANGLDQARAPSDVLAAADTYITTEVTASNLPTT